MIIDIYLFSITINKTIIVIVIFIRCNPIQNLDEFFSYNHMALMSLRSRSHVNSSTVLTRANNLFIHYYYKYYNYHINSSKIPLQVISDYFDLRLIFKLNIFILKYFSNNVIDKY